MKILSVNTGQPQQLQWKEKTIVTSIFKKPISGNVKIGETGLEGDQQSDLSVHGGEFKAVYAYPSEHYSFWEPQFPDLEFDCGMFGENLTIVGLLEDQIRLGDVLKVGTAELRVTQPRFPCIKIGLKFNDVLMVKKFLESRRSGFYFSVLQKGEVLEGDEILILDSNQSSTTIREFVDIYADKNPTQNRIEAMLRDVNLIDDWKDFFQNKLIKAT